MVCVFLLAEAYSEIVDYEREHDIACDVTEQAWGIGALDVAVGAEVPDETGLAELAGLGQSVHTFSDFEIYVLVIQ
jgi:hypothetical protein